MVAMSQQHIKIIEKRSVSQNADNEERESEFDSQGCIQSEKYVITHAIHQRAYLFE